MSDLRRVAKHAIGACLCLCGLLASALYGQNAATTNGELVRIQVDARASRGAFKPVWSFFGYDEPNYTYAENGKKLLGELRGLSAAPVYVRVHNLLTSGDGTAAPRIRPESRSTTGKLWTGFSTRFTKRELRRW